MVESVTVNWRITLNAKSVAARNFHVADCTAARDLRRAEVCAGFFGRVSIAEGRCWGSAIGEMG